jgi:Domain of unknown function (DUF4145)
MIRDFWKIQKPRLIEEIEGLKDKVDSLTWDAIDALRKLGNIGAHMEKDVNMIIDVDAAEAGKMISLIEILVKEWYVAREEKHARLSQLATIAGSKKPTRQP